MQKLHFYTEGEGFTNLLQDFFLSGEYIKLEQILLDGGLSKDLVKKFMKGELYFEGSTKEYPHTLSVNFKTFDRVIFTEKLLISLKTCYSSSHINLRARFEFYELKKIFSESGEIFKEFMKFFEYFNSDEIKEFLSLRILNEFGYFKANPLERNEDGVILEDGTFIKCGFQEHRDLYPILSSLYLADSSDWTDDNITLHISGGEISGALAHSIEHYTFKDIHPTTAQLKTLFLFRESITGMYGDYSRNRTITTLLLEYYNELLNQGGKFCNLKFLEDFYSDILKIPKFSLSMWDIKLDNVFLRTSPISSLPGLLNSKLIKKSNTHKKKALLEIDKEYNKFRYLVKETRYENRKWVDNSHLRVFYQEFIKGISGVCHYYFGKNESFETAFKYQVSNKHGEVVLGKKSDIFLTYEQGLELRKICEILYKDLQKPLQIEFIFEENSNQLYILQLRVLENHYEETVIYTKPKSDILYEGFTFSRGNEELDIEDILIVESDGKSELLLNKKALIVESDVEFSHLLALSKKLKIPSMFNTGKIDFKDVKKVNFIAQNKQSWILKN